MIILRKTPDEYTNYDFDQEIEIDPTKVIITGNRHYKDFGDDTLIEVVYQDYYDEDVGYNYEIMEELKKLTGNEWEQATIRGYSQGEWQEVFYEVEYLSQEELQRIEDYYFGKVAEFSVHDEETDDCFVTFIPNDIVWEGKKAICKYLDLDPEQTKILVDDGYTKQYKYKEVN